MKSYEKIYDYLKDKTDFTSGEEMANHFNLSRTAVWKAIKNLEDRGIHVISLKHKGYKLDQGDLILADTLAQSLHMPVYYNKKCQSTQIDAKNGIEENHIAPALYVASSQSQGKGRFDRKFYSPVQGGIYMSLRLKPNVSAEHLKPYTMMVASCIVKAISRLTGIKTKIKWVNDIYLENRKIAGILTEAITSIETGLITDVIIGVGINFHISNFPDELHDIATSLFLEHPTITRHELITEIWKLFFTIPEKELIKVYRDTSLVLNKKVTFVENNQIYSGLVTDINKKGYLKITLDDGKEKILKGGEISLTSWNL